MFSPQCPNHKTLEDVLDQIKKELDVEKLLKSGKIGQFVVEKWLGSGGQANVFSAHDPENERRAILKIYRDDLGKRSGELIQREIAALNKISSDYVPRVFGCGEEEGTQYLVLEHVTGTPLNDYAVQTNPTLSESVRLTRQVAQGVHAAHSAGILHLDIKPSNVIVTSAGNVKLLDFGLAAPLGSVPERLASGSASYMSPEVANGDGDKISMATDIYGVGVILHFLLTGHPPWRGESKQDVILASQNGKLKSVGRLRQVSIELARICEKALSRAPEDRYGKVEEFLDDLNQVSVLRWSWNKIGIFAGLVVLAIIALVLSFNRGFETAEQLVGEPQNHMASLLVSSSSSLEFPNTELELEARLNTVQEMQTQTDEIVHLFNVGDLVQVDVKIAKDGFFAVYKMKSGIADLLRNDLTPAKAGRWTPLVVGTASTVDDEPQYLVAIASTRDWEPKRRFKYKLDFPAHVLRSQKDKMKFAGIRLAYQIVKDLEFKAR